MATALRRRLTSVTTNFRATIFLHFYRKAAKSLQEFLVLYQLIYDEGMEEFQQ